MRWAYEKTHTNFKTPTSNVKNTKKNCQEVYFTFIPHHFYVNIMNDAMKK